MFIFEPLALVMGLVLLPVVQLILLAREQACGCPRRWWFGRKRSERRLLSVTPPVKLELTQTVELPPSDPRYGQVINTDQIRYCQSSHFVCAFTCRYCKKQWSVIESEHTVGETPLDLKPEVRPNVRVLKRD
ncbi:MAG: hypothetical protein ACKO6N_05000 [Myxococcota bacterium]